MFTRVRIATGFAIFAILITSISAFAKGGFSYIAITGSDLKEEIRSDDPALTEDFFAFADFYQNRIKAPVNPGAGYEITRYYLDGKREIAFDRLHYYPESSFVYYDGIVNGSSEYDGEWYAARSGINIAFENALSSQLMSRIQSSASTVSTARTQPGILLPPLYMVLLSTLGIGWILLFTYRIRNAFCNGG